ncbi:MAG: LptA/OstA family protein [Desulfomonilia bacterium]
MLSAQDLTGAAAQADMIEIEADRLDVNTQTGEALFQGNVKAHKDTISLTSSTLSVTYNRTTNKVSRLIARGEVTILWEDKEAFCQEVVYDLDSQTMELSGDVLITRGQEKLSGQKVTIDMASDTQTVEGQGGRVKILVNTDQESGILQWEN